MPEKPIMPVEKIGAKRTYQGGNAQKYFLDDRSRKLIMDLYDGSRKRTDMLQRHIPGVPRRIIQRWAKELGKVHPRAHWTDRQEKQLRENFNKISMRKLQKLLHKRKLSILSKAASLGLTRENNSTCYNASELALSLGVNTNKIYLWIEKGWLRARKTDTAFAHDVWQILPKDIHSFILSHPNELDPHRFDWLWVVDILSGDGGIGELGTQMRGEKE